MSFVDVAPDPLLAERQARFLARTYAHLLGAVVAFVAFEVALFQSGLAEPIARAFLSVNWLVVLGGFILVAWLFCLTGFHLGLWSSAAMIVYAGACILYDTSNVLHHFAQTHAVAAALELFASVALLFWYVIDVLMEWDG